MLDETSPLLFLDTSECSPLSEDTQPKWLGVEEPSQAAHEEHHDMLDSEDSDERSGRVFLESLKPWQDIVDLVRGIAGKADVCEDSTNRENVHGELPSSNIMGLASEWSPSVHLHLEGV